MHMAERYKNRYRSESARARWWDYSNNGVYYVTIRTLSQDRCFGKVVNDQAILSKIGQIAYVIWQGKNLSILERGIRQKIANNI